MKSIVRLISVFSFVFAIVGCSSYEELTFGPVNNVKVQKFDRQMLQVIICVSIDNQNTSSVKIKDADLIITNGNSVMGMVKQIDNLVIEGKTKKVYNIPVNVEITDASAPLASAFSFLTGKKPDIRIKGSLTAGTFLFKRTLTIDEPIPLKF